MNSYIQYKTKLNETKRNKKKVLFRPYFFISWKRFLMEIVCILALHFFFHDKQNRTKNNNKQQTLGKLNHNFIKHFSDSQYIWRFSVQYFASLLFDLSLSVGTEINLNGFVCETHLNSARVCYNSTREHALIEKVSKRIIKSRK